MGEGVDRHAPPPRRDKRRVKVRISLFFDGTGNNRTNTVYRQQHPRRYWWYSRAPGTGSYENDWSNVARLEQNVGDAAAGYDFYIRLYVEGVGTADELRDNVSGMAAGVGSTGIKSKVMKGLSRALAVLVAKYKPDDVILDRVSLDTCGFSRGAAAARYCVHRALNDRRAPLRAHLEGRGYEVGTVEAFAVGLFDTVSSHGWSLSAYEDDVAVLHLDSVRQAKAVYQLAAAEEYRQRFSLTDITSAGGRGRQVYLPGAHSDVGGGYNNGAGEDQTLVVGNAADEVGRFLLHRGWYRNGPAGRELVYRPAIPPAMTPYGHPTPPVPARLSGRRASIAHVYSFIPLRLMADFFKKHDLAVRPKLYSFHNPGAVPGRARIEAYAQSAGQSRPSDWEGADPELNALRHGYLHISFRNETGMGVRLTGDNRPTRRVFTG